MFRLSVFILASLVSLSWSANAQEERWFEVELYLYSHDGASQEQWPTTPAKPKPRKMVDFITPLVSTDITALKMGLDGCSASEWATDSGNCNEQLTSANQVKSMAKIPVVIAASQPASAIAGGKPVLLAQSQSQFQDIIARLSARRGNKSLLHMTWQQAMKPRNRAVPVHLYSGHDFSDVFEMNGQPMETAQTSEAIPSFSFMTDSVFNAPPKPVWKLDGTLNIYLDHYLFIETAINLREEGTRTLLLTQDGLDSEVESQKVSSPFLYSIAMQQNRRVRSGEIHYFDHPKMGMIIQIRKMEQPSPSEELVE